MSGRYTFFVAFGVPTDRLSICTVAVFGTRYIREVPLKSTIVVKAGDTYVFTVPHVYSEYIIANILAIDLRQKAGSELSSVTFTNGKTSTDVSLDATSLSPGEYTLVLESFDLNVPELALKTDIIKIIVMARGCSLTQSDFDSFATVVGEPIQLQAFAGVSEDKKSFENVISLATLQLGLDDE